MEADPERPGKPVFYSPRGIRIPEVPPRVRLDGRVLGAGAAGQASSPPRWEKDVPVALYLRAMEALG